MTSTRERRLLALLLAWTFVVHLLFALSAGPPNFWDHYTGRQYRDIAESLVAGLGYVDPITSMPLYNLVLAGLLTAFGHASLPLLLLHVGLGVLTTFLTYKIARAFFSAAVALLAGLLISVHPYLVKLTMQIIDTGPSVALCTLAMWLLVRAWLNPSFSSRRYALAGAVFGLATLTRPSSGPYTLAIALGLFACVALRRRYLQAIKILVALLLAWAAIMSPWWARNYVRYRRFIPFTMSATAFLKGHTPYYTRVHPIYDTDHFPYYEHGDDDAQRALAYIREHPAEAITTDLRKVVWLYTWHKVPRSLVDSEPRWDPVQNTVVDDGNPRPALQDVVYSLYWVPVFVLFVSGVILSRRRWRELTPIYLIMLANALVVSLVFADTRYRLEVDPYIAMWAACAVAGLGTRLRSRFLMRPAGAS